MSIEEYANSLIAKGVSEDEFITLMQEFNPDTDPPKKEETATETTDAIVEENGTASNGEEPSLDITESPYLSTYEVPEQEKIEVSEEGLDGEEDTTIIENIEPPVVSFMKSHDKEKIQNENLTLKSINRVKPTSVLPKQIIDIPKKEREEEFKEFALVKDLKDDIVEEEVLVEFTNPQLAEKAGFTDVVEEGPYKGFYRTTRSKLGPQGYEYVNTYVNEQGEEVQGESYTVEADLQDVNDLMEGKYVQRQRPDEELREIEVTPQTVVRSTDYIEKRIQDIDARLDDDTLPDSEKKQLLNVRSSLNRQFASNQAYFQTLLENSASSIIVEEDDERVFVNKANDFFGREGGGSMFYSGKKPKANYYFKRNFNRKSAREIAEQASSNFGGFEVDFSYLDDQVIAIKNAEFDQDKRIGQLDYISTINKYVDSGDITLSKKDFPGNTSKIFNEETGKIETKFLTKPERRVALDILKNNGLAKTLEVNKGFLLFAGKLDPSSPAPFGESVEDTRKEAYEMADFVIENKGNFSRDKQFNIVAKQNNYVKSLRANTKQNSKQQKQLLKDADKTSKQLQVEFAELEDQSSALKVTEDRIKTLQQDADTRIANLEAQSISLDDEAKQKEETFKSQEQQLNSEIKNLQQSYQAKINKAASRTEQELLNEEFKSKQEEVLNKFEPVFDDYNDYIKSYNDKAAALNEEKNSLESDLARYQTQFNEYEAQKQKTIAQQDKVEKINLKLLQSLSSVQALTDMTVLQNNNIAIQANLFQEQMEKAKGQGSWSSALYNRFIEDLGKTFAGRAMSFSQIPYWIMEAEKAIKKGFNSWDEEDQISYDYYMGNIKASQAEANAFSKVFKKAFEDTSTDAEYMQAYANTTIGGILNTVVTLYAAQIGTGVYVGINPFSSGISKGLANLPQAVLSKAGTMNAINLGRGFYSMSLANTYEDIERTKTKFVDAKTNSYIEKGLSESEARRKANRDYNEATNYGRANQTLMTVQASVEGTLEFVTGKILQGGGKYSKKAVDAITGWVMKSLPKGRYTTSTLTSEVTKLLGPKLAAYISTGGNLAGMGSEEAITELAQEFSSIGIDKWYEDATGIDMEIPDISSEDFLDEMKHIAGVAFGSAIFLGGYATVQQGKQLRFQNEFNQYVDAYNFKKDLLESQNQIFRLTDDAAIDIANEAIENDYNAGIISEEEMQNRKDNLAKQVKAYKTANNSKYNARAIVDMANLQIDINEIKTELKESNTLTSEREAELKETLKAKEQEQIDISKDETALAEFNPDTAFASVTEAAEKLAEVTGAEIITVSNRNDIADVAASIGEDLKAYDANGKEIKTEQLADGMFLTDGKTIIINEEIASGLGNISAATHEIFHKILQNQFGNNEIDKAALVEQFKSNLSQAELGIIDARLDKQYSGEGSSTEEYFNAFHDALVAGEIKFSDGKFGKIGDFVTQKIFKPLGFKNAQFGFETGKQAYNFLKEYSKQTREIAKGTRQDFSQEIIDVIKDLPNASTSETPSKVSKSSTIKETLDKIDLQDGERKFNTKEEFQREALADAWMEIGKEGTESNPNIFEGTIRSIGVRNGVPTEALPDFINKVKERLQERLANNFDPAKNNLFGFFFGKTKAGKTIIELSTGDVAKQYQKKPKTVSRDAMTEGRQPDVADVSQDIEAMIDDTNFERPKSKLRRQITLPGNKKISKQEISELEELATQVLNDPKLPDENAKNYRQKFMDIAGKKAKAWVVKNILGGRNRQAYTDSLTDNIPALFAGKNLSMKYLISAEREVPEANKIFTKFDRRLTTQADIRKFKNSGDVFVVNEKQGVNKYDRLVPKPFQVKAFYLGEQSAQNITNKKGKLAEEIGASLLMDITPQTSEKLEFPQAKRSKIAEQLQREPQLLFSSTITLSPQQLVGQVTVDGKPVKALPGKSNNKWVMTTEEREASERFLRSIAQYFPKEFFTTGNFGFSSRALFGIPEGGSHAGNINRILEGVKFNDNAPKPPKRYEYQSNKKLDESIYGKINTKEFKENESRKLPFLKYVFKTIQKDVKKNPEHAKFWEAIIRDATNSQSHFNRAMAPIAFLVKPGYKGEIVEEHSLPQKLVGQFLLNSAFNGTVDQDFKFIENNYFQGALKKIDDDKLKDPKGTITGNKYNYQQKMPDFHTFELETWVRYINENVNKNLGGINTNDYILTTDGKTLADKFGVGLTQKDLQRIGSKARLENIMPDIISIQNNIIELVLKGTIDERQARELLTYQMSLIPGKVDAKKSSTISLKDSKVLSLDEATMTIDEVLGKAATIDEALKIARSLDQPIKKIRVFDFDDTLATSKNIVFANKDGKTIKLNAEEFAKRGLELKEDGWVMDFSDFNKVTDGGRGPLFEVAKTIKEAKGNEDLFVLTARAPESADAIYEFLKSEGLEFKRDNIIGLGNSTGEAKANWIIDRAAEGYNDFYFADDAYANVRSVQDALSVIDVKSRVQQAMPKQSSTLSNDFNKIIENKTGIASEKIYSKAKAQVRGASKGKFKFFIPYSAEDFQGLLYPLLSKGKLGDEQMAWMKTNLLDPYTRAMQSLSEARLNIMNDFKSLKRQLKNVPKALNKEAMDGFTNEQAIRVYIWNKLGYDVPNISKTDLKELTEYIENNPELNTFADQVMLIAKDGYVKPDQNWLVGTITTDFLRGLNTETRSKYLNQWQQNVDAIFSEENLNKLEAAYGAKYREALENILARMKSGTNRISSSSRLSNRILDYINNSTGAIMFFNTRSAVLQTISAVNFVNWTFNNPYKAGIAFANQKQYWKDFMTLMNSDYLVDRRNGQRINISESEIADAAKTSGNKAKAVLNYILTKGYLPTQYADSFAIASGGATFYRNRIDDLLSEKDSEGNNVYTREQAEEIALNEWRAISEESQQSSDPSKISQQQASDYGRLILAFANTPMQYARLQKRAIQDLANGRGDAKSHISKIAYYGFVQNLIFNALQQAVFALGFGDDEEDDEKKNEKKQEKYLDTANGMLDSLLRGLGIGGATLSVVKNFLLDIYERSGRKRPEYVDSIWKLIQLSPPISSKISKLRQAAWQFDSKKRRQKMYDEGFNIDNPAYEAAAKVISATTNVPLDRVLSKFDNVRTALEEDTEFWQTIAMLAGWPAWLIKPDDKQKKSDTVKIGSTKVKVAGSSKPNTVKIKIAQ